MKEDKQVPQKHGYYWVKTNGYKWCNGIVKVYGDFPFYKVTGWNWADDRRITDISDIDEFGKQIEENED